MVSLFVFAHDILLISLSFNSERERGEDGGQKILAERRNLDCGGIQAWCVKKERIEDRKRSGQKR